MFAMAASRRFFCNCIFIILFFYLLYNYCRSGVQRNKEGYLLNKVNGILFQIFLILLMQNC